MISTVAPQALLMLNHHFVLDQAARLAKRLLHEAGGTETARIHWVYQVLFARPPRSEDVEIGHRLLAKSGPVEEIAWRDLAHVLLCTNEFIYLD